MNVLTVGVTLFALAGAILVPLLMAGAYLKFRGKRVVTCPETGQPTPVEVDAWSAALSAVFGEPSLRLKACARWPEHRDCGQECLQQIQSDPEELLAKWCRGKVCVRCGKPIRAISPQGHRPALVDASGKIMAWETIPAKQAPEVLATSLPLCWTCHHHRNGQPVPVSGPEPIHVPRPS